MHSFGVFYFANPRYKTDLKSCRPAQSIKAPTVVHINNVNDSVSTGPLSSLGTDLVHATTKQINQTRRAMFYQSYSMTIVDDNLVMPV